ISFAIGWVSRIGSPPELGSQEAQETFNGNPPGRALAAADASMPSHTRPQPRVSAFHTAVDGHGTRQFPSRRLRGRRWRLGAGGRRGDPNDLALERLKRKGPRL